MAAAVRPFITAITEYGGGVLVPVMILVIYMSLYSSVGVMQLYGDVSLSFDVM